MAVPEKIQNRAEALIDEVNNSNMLPGDKDISREVLIDAKKATNGLPMEEKVAANAETLFNLAYLMVRHMVGQADSYNSWKQVIVECRWPIVICVGIVSMLLAFHPELATILNNIATK